MATTETVTRAPSRRKKKKTAKAQTKKPKTQPTQSAPVVDVPAGQDDKINALVESNKKAVGAYLKENFQGVTKDVVVKVTREAVECAFYKRTPTKNELWDETIIEEIVKNAIDLNVPTEPKQEATSGKTQKKAQPAKEKPATKKKASKKKASKKKTTKKKATKKKATKKKSSKKKASKKKSTSKKRNDNKGPGKSVAELKEDLKAAKGPKRFEVACAILKKEKKVWMQAQDIPSVAAHLHKVAKGTAKIPKEGLPGKGEKDYGRRRLLKTLKMSQELIQAAEKGK